MMILATNCFLVKGYLESLIYDIQRECYYEIDNETYEIFLSGKLELLPSETRDFYVSNEVILTIIPTDTVFAPINTDFKIPYHFNSIIFETSNCAVSFLEMIIQKFRTRNLTKYIYICNSNTSDFKKIQGYLEYLDIVVYINIEEQSENLRLVSYPVQFSFNISPEQNFSVNPPTFFESQTKNVFYNKVLCIDSKGQITRTIDFKNTVGYSTTDFNEMELSTIMSNLEEPLDWNVSKNDISVCSDCKFRFMCYDNSEIIKRENGTRFRALECNYNPYISKWDTEDGYLTLSECGVINDKSKFSIDHKKIEEINKKLWG